MYKFVTYGDNLFQVNRGRLCKDIADTNMFEVLEYDESNLPRSYLNHFSGYPKPGTKGGGYWTWKPWVVLDALERSEKDDVILWCDAGCSLNKSAIVTLKTWIELCVSNNAVVFQSNHIERQWTKRSVVSYMNCDKPEYMDTGQIWAGGFLLKNNDTIRSIVSSWANMSKLIWTFDDSPSTSPNYEDFVEHRHDQSVFSLIVKSNLKKYYTLPESKVWPYNGDWYSGETSTSPIWASRKRS